MMGNTLKQAWFYEKTENGKVHCSLCPHNCIIKPENTGVCRVRENIGGDVYSLNYARITSLSLDPIEKKPLYLFHPGSVILSAGTFGCNLKCSFCQNWSIAHTDAETAAMEPEQLVRKAYELRKSGNIGIAYTYNEPSIWYEFVYESAVLAREKGLCNVLVTNGFIGEEPLKKLLPYIDAMNIDVKAFTESFYGEICKGALRDVKRTVEIAAPQCHVEVTTLVIPGLNDSTAEIGELSAWLASISDEIPLHLTRFFPNYKMTDRLPTPLHILKAAKDKAEKHLKHVFIGNV